MTKTEENIHLTENFAYSTIASNYSVQKILAE